MIKSLKKENLLKQNNVVVFTASSDPKLLDEIKKSGVSEILQKPCGIDKLAEVIGKYGSN